VPPRRCQRSPRGGSPGRPASGWFAWPWTRLWGHSSSRRSHWRPPAFGYGGGSRRYFCKMLKYNPKNSAYRTKTGEIIHQNRTNTQELFLNGIFKHYSFNFNSIKITKFLLN
jgi:hypothetical protein